MVLFFCQHPNNLAVVLQDILPVPAFGNGPIH